MNRRIVRSLLTGVAVALVGGGSVTAQLDPASWALGVEKGALQLAENGKMQDLLKDYSPLSPEDRALDAAYPTGPAQLPSACVERPAACESCGYASALDDLQATRYRLEKLRRIYASTKNMVKHSLAVGDSMAGAAGVGGLEWAAQRTKIVQSMKNLQSAYDSKYAELMEKLQDSLQTIAQCEGSVYGEKDWYQRYGFMYYEFMAGRYQRAD